MRKMSPYVYLRKQEAILEVEVLKKEGRGGHGKSKGRIMQNVTSIALLNLHTFARRIISQPKAYPVQPEEEILQHK